MPRLLICTVGTSLLTNRDDRSWAGWDGRRKDPLPDVKVVDGWLAAADPVVASAETNTLRAVGLDAADRVVLLHSDTPEGLYCCQRLQSYLEAGRCRSAEPRKIAALGYQTGSF